MTEKPASMAPRMSLLRRWTGFVRNAALRMYSLALIVLIMWLTWLVFSYLIGVLLIPAEPSPRVVGLPRRLDVDVLRTEREDWLALAATPHPRSPLSHYHRLESWIQHDIGNDCTTSGCHAPLPHAVQKETRAFLNMHSTVLHCGVCHMEASQTPLPLVWYDIGSAAVSEPPVIFSALNTLVTTQAMPSNTTEDARRVETLLQQAVVDSGRHPQLVALLERFRVTRPGGEQWEALVELAVQVLPTHFRGEYGRKLALPTPRNGTPMLGHAGSREAIRRFQTEGASLDGAKRSVLLMEVHRLRREAPVSCTDCHTARGSIFPYTQLGYEPGRIRDLASQPVFSMIENISRGRAFHLPAFLDRRNEP